MAFQPYRGPLRFAARRLAVLQVRPNQVTCAALLVSLLGAALFAIGVAPVVAALTIAFGGWLDALDGELARSSARSSKFGSYLDAMCDRVADGAVLLAVAVVSGAFLLCLLAATTGAWVSYAKARAALELPLSNSGWPNLMGREARVVLLAFGISLGGALPHARLFGLRALDLALLALVLGSLFTTLQRFRLAKRLLEGSVETRISTASHELSSQHAPHHSGVR